MMTMVSFGDLAQSYMLKSQTSRLKSETGRITQELSSGRLSDIPKSLSGDTGRLSALTRSHDLAKGYLSAAKEGAFRAGAMQRVIAKIATGAQALAPSLLASPQSEAASSLALQARLGADQLEATISALNMTTSGRTLFSGVATNRPAVVPTETLLAALRVELAGATTPDEMMSRISTWFDAPPDGVTPGFANLAYSGGPPTADLAVSPEDTAWLGVTANDPAFRDALKGFAAAALINDPAVSLSAIDMGTFARLAGERVVAGNDALIGLAASLGVSEARIDTAVSRNSAELLTLEMATADLVQSDPYTLATELEAVQTNLETLYAITARLSRLSLTDFMR